MAIKDTLDKMKTTMNRFLWKSDREKNDPAGAGPRQEGYAPDSYAQGPYVPQGQFIPQDQYVQPQTPYAAQQQYTAQQPSYTQNPYAAQQPRTDVNSSIQMPVTENTGAAAEVPPSVKGQPRNEQAMYVLTVRTIHDCRNAIAILRDGAAVLLVMEGVTDTQEMRRFVDTLSGACFSLSATISKVSHHGSYLLVPKHVSLMLDPAINQMNISPRARMRQQMQSPVQGQPYGTPQQSMYANSPYQPQPSPYTNGTAYQQPNTYMQQGQPVPPAYDPQSAYAPPAYDPRMQSAAEVQTVSPMVERMPVRPSAMPAFEQQYGSGYVPDAEE